MKNLKLTAIAFCISTSLIGCNDGSGFVSTQKPAAETEQNNQSALRNITQDNGVSINAIDANSPSAEGITNLIDNNINSKFLTFASTAEVVFTGSAPYVLKGYQLSSANDAPERDPAMWTVEGSNDKTTWTEIDSQSKQVFSERFLSRNFDLDNNEQEFQHYRFKFSATSGDIFQLAELQLMVPAKAPIVDFSQSAKNISIGEYVIFWDQSLVSPTAWQWTFESGSPATSNENSPLTTFTSFGVKQISLTASNDKGDSTLTKNDAVNVWDDANGFIKPEVSFVKNEPNHPGQLALDKVLPDLEEVIHTISLKIAERLYQKTSDIPPFKTIRFVTNDYDFPAAKGGSDEDMVLMFDIKHLANVAAAGDAALREEVLGVLWHELTHGYNNVPNTGEYVVGTDYHTYLESLANYMRIEAGYHEAARAKIKWIDNWNEDAYEQTSFFLEWVGKTYTNIDFMVEFNKAAGNLPQWSFDAAFKSIFGEESGIEVIFAQYQDYLNSIGIFPRIPKGYHNFAADSDVQISSNATEIVKAEWGIDESAHKLNDNDIYTKYNGVIAEPSWFSQYFAELLPLNIVENVQVDFVLPAAQVLNKYVITTGNDNESRDPSGWSLSASNDGVSWTILDTNSFPNAPFASGQSRLTNFSFDIEGNSTAYTFYRFTFENNQEGTGGDAGKLIQLGEITLLSKQ